MGTLQDTLAAARPLICVYEDSQIEMAHLAERVEELGLGLNLGHSAHTDMSSLRRGIEQVTTASAQMRLWAARGQLGTDGLNQAADWFTDFLRTAHRPSGVKASIGVD